METRIVGEKAPLTKAKNATDTDNGQDENGLDDAVEDDNATDANDQSDGETDDETKPGQLERVMNFSEGCEQSRTLFTRMTRRMTVLSSPTTKTPAA